MKNLKEIILALISVMFLHEIVNAQCENFVKKNYATELSPYIFDGIYSTTTMIEGGTAELYKTVYSGQEYRIAILSDEMLPKIEFEIMDIDRNILFSNKSQNYTKLWDFCPESNKQLIILIQVPQCDNIDYLAHGCVAIMFGFLDNKDCLKQL